MTLASALGAVTLLTELALLGVLASRRVYRTLPLFMAYFAYSVILMAAGLATSPGTPLYLFVWILGVTIDTLFYLGVLAELGQSVLRFNRASPMPWGLVVLLFIGASVPISLLAQWPEIGHYDMVSQLEFRVMQATGVFEIAGLLTLLRWSGFKKLRWPERELRLMWGMASWALVQLTVLVLHEHGLMGPGYHWLDLLTPSCVLVVLLYWLHYFWLDPASKPETLGSDSGTRAAEAVGAGEG